MNTTVTAPLYLSKKGMKELKKNIATLEYDLKHATLALRELDKTDGHDERLDRIERLARIDGMESELAEKQLYLKRAKLLPRKRDALRVALGSVVDLADQSGRMIRYTIVDSFEANPSDGRISTASPLGQRLLGKTVKETIDWTNGLRVNRMVLVGIS